MAATCTIQFVLEKKDSTTGKSTWAGDGTATISVEDVSVSTMSNIQTINDGDEPTIIPFGVKERTATLTGTMYNTSMNGPNYINKMDPIYVDSLGTIAARGIRVNDPTNIPELGTAVWKINKWDYEGDASKGSQWKFRLSLSYAWDPSINEIQLFADGVGNNTPESVRFFAKLKSGGSLVQIYNTRIDGTLHDLNRAKFETYNTTFSKGNHIQIMCETSSTPVFYGIVIDKRNNTSGNVVYDCTEIATLLYRKPCAKIKPGLFKPRIRIPNPFEKKYLKLQQFVSTILKFYNDGPLEGYSPGNGYCSSSAIFESEYLPGRTGSYIAPQILSGMTVGKALDNLLCEQCGLYIWYANDTGRMEYGFQRNSITMDLSKEYIMYSEQVASQGEDYEADGVILMDNSANQPTRWPVGIDNSGSFVQYKFNSDLTNEQLTSIAQRIYSDLKQNRDTFKVKFPPGTVRYKEGDSFTGLGDSTVTPNMPYRGGTDEDPTDRPGDSVWQIKEITITSDYTECLVGSSYYSVFDIYRTALQKYDGCPAPTETKDKETNTYALPARSESSTEE